jgi:hypothetical protein
VLIRPLRVLVLALVTGVVARIMSAALVLTLLPVLALLLLFILLLILFGFGSRHCVPPSLCLTPLAGELFSK